MNILLEIFHSLACPKKPPTWVIMPKLKLLEFYFCYFLGKSFTESKEINNIFKDCSCRVYGTSEILVNALKADNNSTTCQLKLFFFQTWNLSFMKVINVLAIFVLHWYFTCNFICQVVPTCVE